MHSDMISKIAKAQRYAQEPERIQLNNIQAQFRGGNNDHEVQLNGDQWSCDCEFFRLRNTCAHVMAFQQIFQPMLSQEALEGGSQAVGGEPAY